MAAKEKRVFRHRDAQKNAAGKYVLFGISTAIDKDTLNAKLDSGEWVEVDHKTGKDKAAPKSDD